MRWIELNNHHDKQPEDGEHFETKHREMGAPRDRSIVRWSTGRADSAPAISLTAPLLVSQPRVLAVTQDCCLVRHTCHCARKYSSE